MNRQAGVVLIFTNNAIYLPELADNIQVTATDGKITENTQDKNKIKSQRHRI